MVISMYKNNNQYFEGFKFLNSVFNFKMREFNKFKIFFFYKLKFETNHVILLILYQKTMVN